MTKFFEKYMNAYLTHEPSAFSEFFSLPCLIVDSNGDHVVASSHDVERYFQPFVDGLKAAGLREIDFDIEAVRRVNDSECFCTNRYRIYASQRRLIGDMEYHYYLVRNAASWQIKFSRMGETRYWAI